MKTAISAVFLSFVFLNHALAQDDGELTTIVWSGSKQNAVYEALAKRQTALKVRTGGSASANEVQVRPAFSVEYVEVKHKKANNWLQVKVPTMVGGQIDATAFSTKLFQISNCDQVKAILSLTDSTPKTEMYFNSKPIGPVKDDGRFYYESGAVCRDEKIELVGTLPKCKNFSASFKAVNNPHKYEGNAIPDCSKKSASR